MQTATLAVGAWMFVSTLDGESVIAEGGVSERQDVIFPHSSSMVMGT